MVRLQQRGCGLTLCHIEKPSEKEVDPNQARVW
jgi:hypothetical protein